jgi:hypothetical protein
MLLFEDWRASREQMLRTRPDSLVAVAEEFAARLWLMARLMAALDGSTASVTAKAEPPAVHLRPRSEPRASANSAASTRPVGRAVDRQRSDGGALFSEIPRPGRVAKTDTEKAKKRAGAVVWLQSEKRARKYSSWCRRGPKRPAGS